MGPELTDQEIINGIVGFATSALQGCASEQDLQAHTDLIQAAQERGIIAQVDQELNTAWLAMCQEYDLKVAEEALKTQAEREYPL